MPKRTREPGAGVRSCTIFVLNPAGLDDPALAIAAARAGAVGVINAELGGAGYDPLIVLDRARQFATGQLGVKLGGAQVTSIELLIQADIPGPSHLVLDLATCLAHQASLQRFRSRGGQVHVEVTAWEPRLAGIQTGIDGWWLKGHEAGGRVGEQCSFVLAQDFARRSRLPFSIRGGVNLHSAAACRVVGASGLVLDDQVLLLRDSPLADVLAPKLKSFTGQETTLIEDDSGEHLFRFWMAAADRQTSAAKAALVRQGFVDPEAAAAFGWAGDGAGQLVAFGQDGAVARHWAEQFSTLSAALHALREAVWDRPADALRLKMLEEGTPIAQAHGTRLPLVQGPMTHVSDRAPFIGAVAAAGGLPMVAVSLMRGEAVRSLLRETSQALGDLPWGVGLLGFVPPDILDEQRAAIRETPPHYAIIAGGRPDQAQNLERAGIRTYIHVPSPVLLEQFLDRGARCFIFEGRECGGHVGPLGSFALWGLMVDALLRHPVVRQEAGSVHVLFAGGIHDGRSAAAAATVASPLATAGVKVGFLMGTAYIFTREALQSGAITAEFQRTAIACERTDRLTTGPGHASRCARTPFVAAFRDRRRELERNAIPANAIREELEALSLGRLRLATKGLYRVSPDSRELVERPLEEQQQGGMFMIGQAAMLRAEQTSVEDLHRSVSQEAIAHLRRYAEAKTSARTTTTPRPADVAIIGIGTLLPQSTSASHYWENILRRFDAIVEIPLDRWDSRDYFDDNRRARDKVYSRWGGFLEAIPFDPAAWGMPPNSVRSIDPFQLLTLEVVRQALQHAGYDLGRIREREGTSVILGFSGGLGEHGLLYGVRSEMPRLGTAVSDAVLDSLPEWTEDTFAGLLPNVAAGRAANRFDFGGLNFTIDAACASSLAAVYMAVVQLETGRSDLVIAGGVDTLQSPFAYLCFSKTHALSPGGRSSTFDADSDGIVISEGLATIVLKRLADAERDGDTIYAVIKGVGGSSDGRAKGLTAPLPSGQQRALQRAYAQAGFSPATVGLIEAHGTGTVAGDQAELETVTGVLRAAGAMPASCAIGSVKTNIGHTKAAAGVAGLIKAALALHHRVLPPHRGVKRPNPALRQADCPVYLSQTPRPWVRHPDHSRRAGVSSFGFGGTNFHIALEGYEREHRTWLRAAPWDQWPSELFVWRAGDRASLGALLQDQLAALEHADSVSLSAISRALATSLPSQGASVAIVADSITSLRSRMGTAVNYLGSANGARPVPPGVHYYPEIADSDAQVAVLFSGQGSQYPDMLREVAVAFPELARTIEQAEVVLRRTDTFTAPGERRLSQLIYPPDRFSKEEEAEARNALMRTQIAQPALGAVEAGLWQLLVRLALRPAALAGHSYGEYVALYAAGVLSLQDLALVSEARGRFIAAAAAEDDLGTMAAVRAGGDAVRAALGDRPEVTCANFNGPVQTVISGSRAAVARAGHLLESKGFAVTPLPVAAAFHSPLMDPAKEPLGNHLQSVAWRPPRIPVYANSTGQRHADTPDEIRATMAEHLVCPVLFEQLIVAMHQDGARVFLEVGPRSVLSELVKTILTDRPHLSVAIDGSGGGLTGFLNSLAALVAAGVQLDLGQLFHGRNVPLFRFSEFGARANPEALPKSAWLVNGGYAIRPGEQPRLRALAQQAPPKGPSEHDDQIASMPAVAPEAPLPEEIEPEVLPPSTELPELTKHKEAPIMNEIGPPMLAVADGSVDQTMVAYHQIMLRFLQLEERVMTAYLGLGPAPGGDALAVPGLSGEPVAPFAFRSSPALTANGNAGNGVAAGAANGLGGAVPAPSQPAHVAPAPAPVAPEPKTPPAAVVTSGRSASNGTQEGAAGAGNGAAPPPAAPLINLKALLLELVSERTGYPQEMLGLDQEMEADLGIDSIKRLEILGAFREALPPAIAERFADEESMRELSNARSLQGILSFAASRTDGGITRPFELAGEEPEEAACAPLPRYVMRAHAEPVDGVPPKPLPSGVYLITADDLGVATELCARLEGQAVIPAVVPEDAFGSEGRLSSWLAERERLGPIRAVIHLRPLSSPWMPEHLGLDDWRARMHADVKALFPLLRLAASGLRDGGTVITASAMGGVFGRDAITSPARPAFPGGAGNVGLIKSLSLEWQQPHLKAVDLDPAEPAGRLADHLLGELRLAGGRREVGYPAGIRTVFRTEPASLTPAPPGERAPRPDWIVLAVGGARGVTAELLRPLAERRVHLVLVGRSPLPGPEAADTTALASADALRQHFIAEARARGEAVRPVDLEARVKAVLKARELLANTADLEALGARVTYRALDTRDEVQVRALMDQLYDQHGRIDGVVLGAGIIEDQLLVNKSDASVARVLDTKVDSAFLLAQHLRADTLKFFCFLTSVAGRYGNAGQTDYAAANETLNRFAWLLQRRWGPKVKVSAINWGPWLATSHGPGMVTAETRRQFEARGVVLVSPEAGRSFFMSELLYAPCDEVEVIAGESPWEYLEARYGAVAPPASDRLETPLPLLQGSRVLERDRDNVALLKPLDLVGDSYLDHHRIDGAPVMPLAVAAEYMMEAARAAFPEHEVLGIDEIRLFRGIRLKNGRAELQMRTSKSADEPRVAVTLASGSDSTRPNYRGTVVLGRPPMPAAGAVVDNVSAVVPPVTITSAYRRWLFHGPLFQTVKQILSLDEHRVVARLSPSNPRRLCPGIDGGDWIIDPALLDGSLQLVLVWTRAMQDATVLPHLMTGLRRYGAGPLGDELLLEIEFLNKRFDPMVNVRFTMRDADGNVRIKGDKVEGMVSPKLNRIGGGWAGGAPDWVTAS